MHKSSAHVEKVTTKPVGGTVNWQYRGVAPSKVPFVDKLPLVVSSVGVLVIKNFERKELFPFKWVPHG